MNDNYSHEIRQLIVLAFSQLPKKLEDCRTCGWPRGDTVACLCGGIGNRECAK